MSKQGFANAPAILGGFVAYISIRYLAAMYVGYSNAVLLGFAAALLVAYLISRWSTRDKADR